MAMGLEDVVMCDRHGAIYQGRGDLNRRKGGNGRDLEWKKKKKEASRRL